MQSLMDSLESVDWASVVGMVVAAVAIIVVTWLIAAIVKWACKKATAKVKVLQRAGADGHSIGESLGQIGSLLVWLFGLVALLNLLGLGETLAPIQALLDGVMGFLPNLIGAAFVFIVGSILAKVVRQLVETALAAVPFDRWLTKAGAEEVTGNAAISKTIALVLYALIMIVVAIAALQVLGISSISEPAEAMLDMIFTALPNIIAAALLLGIGVVIARFAGDILEQVLDGFGTDRALRQIDVLPADKSASPVIAKVAQVAIVLFFAVMAAQLLDFPQITRFLSEVLELGGRVIFGGAIIAVGFLVANLLAKLVSGTAGTVIRVATLVLFAAMGLKYMGIADSIIELGFGAVVVGGAAAAALAFGLGGREAAARQLAQLQENASRKASSPSTPPRPAAGSGEHRSTFTSTEPQPPADDPLSGPLS